MNDFWLQNQKIRCNFFTTVGIQTVRPRTFPTSPRIKGQKQTQRRNGADESTAMMEGWNSNLETNVHTRCPWGSALSWRTMQCATSANCIRPVVKFLNITELSTRASELSHMLLILFRENVSKFVLCQHYYNTQIMIMAFFVSVAQGQALEMQEFYWYLMGSDRIEQTFSILRTLQNTGTNFWYRTNWGPHHWKSEDWRDLYSSSWPQEEFSPSEWTGFWSFESSHYSRQSNQ